MTEAIHLYLNSRRIHCRQERGLPWRRTIVDLPERVWNAGDLATLELQLPDGAGRLRRHLHVYLGSALCKFMIVDLPGGVSNTGELRLVAEASMRRQLGLDAREWTCAVDLGSASARAVVCAIKSELVLRLQELSEAHKMKLVSLRPYVTTIWNEMCEQTTATSQEDRVLLAVEDDAFAVFVAKADKLVSLNSLTHGAEPELIERELRRLEVSAGPGSRERVRLAMSDHVSRSVSFETSRLLTTKQTLNGDFRDLLMRAESES